MYFPLVALLVWSVRDEKQKQHTLFHASAEVLLMAHISDKMPITREAVTLAKNSGSIGTDLFKQLVDPSMEHWR